MQPTSLLSCLYLSARRLDALISAAYQWSRVTRSIGHKLVLAQTTSEASNLGAHCGLIAGPNGDWPQEETYSLVWGGGNGFDWKIP